MINSRRSEVGSALVIALGILVLLAMMGSLFVLQARLQSRAARASADLALVEEFALQRLDTLRRTQGDGNSYTGAEVKKGHSEYNRRYLDNNNDGYADSKWDDDVTKLSKYDVGDTSVELCVRYSVLKKDLSRNLIGLNSHSEEQIEKMLIAAGISGTRAAKIAENLVRTGIPKGEVVIVGGEWARYGPNGVPGDSFAGADDDDDGEDNEPDEFQPFFPYDDDRPFTVPTLVGILVNPAGIDCRLEQVFDYRHIHDDYDKYRKYFTARSVTRLAPEAGKEGIYQQVNINDLIEWIAWGCDDIQVLEETIDFASPSYSKAYARTEFWLATDDSSLGPGDKRDIAQQALIKLRDTLVVALSTNQVPRANQITINLKDFLDGDHDITRLEAGDAASPYYGIEKHPYINEAWIWNRSCDAKDNDDDDLIDEDSTADPVSPEDDVYFVELYNPWDVAIDLSGWRIGSGDPPTSAVASGVSIGAHGYLVLTNMPPAEMPANCEHVAGLAWSYATDSAYDQNKSDIKLCWLDDYGPGPDAPVTVDTFRFPIPLPVGVPLWSAERYVFMIDCSKEGVSPDPRTSMGINVVDAVGGGDTLSGTGSGNPNDNLLGPDVIDLEIADSTDFRFINVGDFARIMEVGYTPGSLAYTQLGDHSDPNVEPHELWNNYRLNEGLSSTQPNDIEGTESRRRICTLASDTRKIYEYFTTRQDSVNAKGERGYTYGYVDICVPVAQKQKERAVFCGLPYVVESNALGEVYVDVDDLITTTPVGTDVAADVLYKTFAATAPGTYMPTTRYGGTIRVCEFGSDGNDLDADGLDDEKDEKELVLGELLNQVSGRPVGKTGVIAYIITCQLDNGKDWDAPELVVYAQKRLLAVLDYTTNPVTTVCQKWLLPLR